MQSIAKRIKQRRKEKIYWLLTDLFKRSAHSAGPVHMSVVVHVPGLGSPKKRQFRNNFENCSMISAAPGTNFDARGVLFGFLETLGVSVDGRRKSKSSEASLF